MARFDNSFSPRTLVCNFNQFNTLYFGCKFHKWSFVTKRISSSRYFYQCCSYFLGAVYSILWKNQVSYENWSSYCLKKGIMVQLPLLYTVLESSNSNILYSFQIFDNFCSVRSIFQTFWKQEGCTNFLLLELETSNVDYLLIFRFSLTVQSFSKIG